MKNTSQMMKCLLSAGMALLASILLPVFAETGSTNVVSSVAGLTQILREGRSGVPFEITAIIIYPYTKQMYRCAVQDDGCGFDPENHPGVLQGHFGLQGIRERVKRFGGTMEIKSEAGKGTKVTIALNLGNGGHQT